MVCCSVFHRVKPETVHKSIRQQQLVRISTAISPAKLTAALTTDIYFTCWL